MPKINPYCTEKYPFYGFEEFLFFEDEVEYWPQDWVEVSDEILDKLRGAQRVYRESQEILKKLCDKKDEQNRGV